MASSRRFTLQSIQPDHAVISVGINWAAGGGHLELRATAVSETRSNIEATWAPSVPTTLLDWGQGARDIRALTAAVNQEAEPRFPPKAAILLANHAIGRERSV